jgi:hypothetical protein
MRFSVLLSGLVWVSAMLAQTPPAADDVLTSANYKPLTGKERAAFFVSDTLLSPLTYVAAVGGGGIQQLNNAPPEWKQGVEGYAKRSASVLGIVMIQESIEQGSAALLGYEPRYIHCGCNGFLKRTGHAVVWSIITKNNAGANRLNLPVLAGAYGSGMLATLAWYPDRFDPLKDGVRLGSYQLPFVVGANWLREFTPDLKRAFHLH